MSVLRTIVSSSRALATGAKDAARFREIAAVFMRHGFGWFIARLRLRRELAIETDPGSARSENAKDTGRRLVGALTELGPTWVKFGQILSTRPDVLPEDVVAELSSLQDRVDPLPFEDVEGMLKRHLGDDWRESFESFDEEPLASASIGQVHSATLTGGRKVVMKVQRPGIEPKIESDLHILHLASAYIEEAFEEARAMNLPGMVEDFAKSLSQELDYRAEAANLERFRRNFESNPSVYFPGVHSELSTDRVLCMEFIEGRKFSDLIGSETDTSVLVENYFDVAYKMLFQDGFFHGDLHPGNVFVLDDDRLAIIDCGMVGRLAPRRKDKVIDIIHAILNEDLEAVARTIYSLAIPDGPVDYAAFEADSIAVAERYLVGVPLSQVQIGELFAELVAGAARHRVRMPTDFTMMFKAIVTTEGLAKQIAPNVDAVQLARPHIAKMVAERYDPERLKQVAIADFQTVSAMVRGLPHSVPALIDGLQSGRVAFGVSEETLVAQERAADARAGRMIRTGFSLACLLAGAMTLGVEGLPMVAWGINLVSAVLWGFATFGAFTLLRRGGLV